MDTIYIDPFVDSVFNAMKTMLGESPERINVKTSTANFVHGDVSGIVGFASNNIFGSVALSFPTKTAIKCYNMMVGDNTNDFSDDVRDTIGELTNIVAGGAKKIYADQGLSFDISIPTIVVGENHSLAHKGGTPVVAIPFALGGLQFIMEISIKLSNGAQFTRSTSKVQVVRA